MSGASGWRDAVLRSAIDAFLCDVAAKSINRGVRNCIDAEKNSAFAVNSSIHALIRCVLEENSCIVTVISCGGGVVWCSGGVNDCIGGAVGPVGRTSVRHRGPLLRAGSLCVDLTGGAYFSRVRPGSSPPAGDFLSCVAKKGSKEGDPASPVVRCANDSPALLEVGGRRGTRRLRRLRLPRRTTPPTSPLLGGSDGLFGITEPGLGLWSGLNGWRKADPLGAFDRNGRLPGASKFVPARSPRSTIASRRVTPCGLTRPTATSPLLGGSDGLSGITEPGLGLSSGLNGRRKAHLPSAFDRNSRLRKGTVPGNGPSEPPSSAATGGEVRRSCLSPQGEFCAGRPLRAAQGSRPQRGRPVKPGRLSCLLLWRSKEVSRPPGANSPANPCWVKHHRQTSAGSRRPPDANPCQPKAPPVGRTSVRHPSWGMARCVGLKSDLQFDLQVSGPTRRGAAMGTTP